MKTSARTLRNDNGATLSRLGKVTCASLIGLAASLMYVQVVVERAITPVPTINAVVLLVVAGVLASGWRRGPLVVTVWTAFMLLGSLQVIVPRFAQPDELHMFIWNIITVVMGVTALGGGIAMMIRNRKVPGFAGYGAEA